MNGGLELMTLSQELRDNIGGKLETQMITLNTLHTYKITHSKAKFKTKPSYVEKKKALARIKAFTPNAKSLRQVNLLSSLSKVV